MNFRHTRILCDYVNRAMITFPFNNVTSMTSGCGCLELGLELGLELILFAEVTNVL